MSTKVRSPGFITHHDLDKLAGTPRTRQRWQEQDLLPRPRWVRVDRSRVGLFPEFVLGPVVVGSTRSDLDTTILRHATRLAEQVCETGRFREVAQAARDVLAQGADPWDFSRFVHRLACLAGPALAEWRADVDAAELELTAHGLIVSSCLAEVKAIEGDQCLVAVPKTAIPLRYPVNLLTWEPEPGEQVVVDSVEVGVRERTFLLPPLIVETAAAPDAIWAPQDQDADSAGKDSAMGPQPGTQVPERLAAIAVRAGSLTSLSTGRQEADWRRQFERGSLRNLGNLADARPRPDQGQRTPEHEPTRILSRPLDGPVFT